MFGIGKQRMAHVTEQLSAYMDNQLKNDERLQVETHLRSCSACAADLRSLQTTVRALRSLPVVAVPRSFILQPTYVPRPAPGLALLALRFASAATAFALLATIGAGVLLRGYGPVAAPPPQAFSAAPAATSAAPAPETARDANAPGVARSAAEPAATATALPPTAAPNAKSAAPASESAPSATAAAATTTAAAPAALAAPMMAPAAQSTPAPPSATAPVTGDTQSLAANATGAAPATATLAPVTAAALPSPVAAAAPPAPVAQAAPTPEPAPAQMQESAPAAGMGQEAVGQEEPAGRRIARSLQPLAVGLAALLGVLVAATVLAGRRLK